MVVLFQRRHAPGSGGDGTGLAVDELIQRGLVGSLFQPVVRLGDRGTDDRGVSVVGFEALARGPGGSELEHPLDMFAAAEEAGLIAELDLATTTAAFTAALEAALPPTLSLFINVDPGSLGRPLPPDLAKALVAAHSRFRVFMEISERALLADPTSGLASLAKARAAGWGISLDQVGVGIDSLSLLEFARPDVVKIDVSLVHEISHPHAPRVMSAVAAYAERTGASLMAVGIETEAHLRTARGLGATLGQGFLFGRPAPLPAVPFPPDEAIRIIAAMPPDTDQQTPFRLATAQRPALPATGAVLGILADHLEKRAVIDPDPTMVLAALPGNQLPSGAPLAFLEVVARSASYTGVLVRDLPRQRLADVRMAALGPRDPMQDELSLILIGPHYAAMLTAQEKAPGRPSGGYDYRLVYDRDTVTRAARLILQRLTVG